ncbi:MAG TPA: glycosyltransferase [Terriglobales bacterium]|nr:glycosyltransferase [Terriglobales bacterium]
MTIVIPAKNEARNLPHLLTSLSRQDYPLLPATRVFVADAGSTDSTIEVALSFADRLLISVIPGGLPSIGRNAGARRATTPYVLFVDSDIELADPTLLRRAMEKMTRKQLHCLTTDIRCKDGRLIDQLMFRGSNAVQHFASFTKPFATGMFMLFDRAKFNKLGGFDESVHYAEDFHLSKRVSPLRFGIVKGHVLTSNRRFKAMGYTKTARMFFTTAFHTFDRKYFERDHGYWNYQV